MVRLLKQSIWLIGFTLLWGQLRANEETLPSDAKVVALQVKPESIVLDGKFSYAQMQLTATLDSGEQLDATRLATWEIPESFVTLNQNKLVRPSGGDGTGRLVATLQGHAVTIPLTVRNTTTTKPVSFVKDVQPVLSKLGCNQGTCHGGAQGKNGFKLSLRGYDPIFDHRSLTDDIEGRRFNRAAPQRSLMLLKPTGAVPHVGGVTMQPNDPTYQLLLQWITEGVKQDLSAPKVTSIEVHPARVTIASPGMKQQFAVIATYSDGSQRDVSAEAFIESSNIETATVDPHGLMTTLRRGEATMLARYEGAYAASSVIIMGDRTGYQWIQRPVFNPIDEFVDEKLKSIKVDVSDICTDAEFLRRVYLDLTGLPPTPEDVSQFLADPKPSQVKRDEVIDKLVGNPAYIEHWTNKWADLLQVNRKFLGNDGAKALRNWIHEALAKNMPYDQFAYEILAANGSNLESPPAGYYKVLRTPDLVMENTTQLFLAIRFNCNKCHDHPFEKWTQDQYYELAAYFAQVQRTEDPKYKGQKIGGTSVEGAVPLVEIISESDTGEIKNDRTGENAIAQFPFVFPEMPGKAATRRETLARWITHKNNPYFAKSYVNRVWSYLLGVGIIEPVDDIRAGNPATNPALLDHLTEQFINSGFDTQSLVKYICKSRTYQLSIATTKHNKDDDQNYSHALPRRLSAEVLYDSIHAATGSLSRLPGSPPGTRAAQLLDSNVDLPGAFLEQFGKPVRESACECERSNTMMLGPVLAMVNGPIVADAVKDPNNKLNQLVSQERDDAKVVEQIYLAVLNRNPTAAERALGIEALQSGRDDYERLLAEAERRRTAFADYEKKIPKLQAAWEQDQLAQKPTNWIPLIFKDTKATSEASFQKQDDDSYLLVGPSAEKDLYTLIAEVTEPNATALRLEVLADASLPSRGPGRAQNGNFVLNDFKLLVQPIESTPQEAKAVKLVAPEADFSQNGFPVNHAIDGNLSTGWAVGGKLGVNHTAIFKIKDGLKSRSRALLTIMLDQRFGAMHTIGRFRISITTDPNPRLNSPVSPELVKLLDIPNDERNSKQVERIRKLYLDSDQTYQRLKLEAEMPVPSEARVVGAQDLVWALLNSPAFLFNR